MSIFDRPIAHRGLHSDNVAENSMPAFSLAVEHNYNIELDVHLTSDGEVVVFHDDTLTRMCGVDKKISECSYSELSNYTLASTEDKIPTLRQVLEFVDNRVDVLIEIKNTGKVGKLESATYDILAPYSEHVSIQSFNPFSVKWFKDNAPSIPRGILATWDYTPSQKWPISYMLRAMWLNPLAKPHFIAYDEKYILTSKYLKKRRKNLKVLSWTVTSKARYDEISSMVDNIIFEGWLP